MQNGKSIEHKGIIKEINGRYAKVCFTSYSACNLCHAKGICTVADIEDKLVDVALSESFNVGEEVMIQLKQIHGYKALLLGYLIPFLIVTTILFALILISGNEAFSAFVSLLLLIPYYLVIYLMRKRIRREFSFSVRKI